MSNNNPFNGISLIEKANKSKKEAVTGVVMTPEYTYTVYKVDSSRIKIVIRNRFKSIMEVVTKCNTFDLWQKTTLRDRLREEYKIRLTEKDFV